MLPRSPSACWILALTAIIAGRAAAQSQTQPQRPTRDTSAQAAQPTATQPNQPATTGKIIGRVLAVDNGRPVKRARVLLSAAQFQGRGTLTDDSGAFEFSELPEGRYALTVSKTGFVSLSYGQRRPLQAGTPLQLAAGQEIKGIDFRLPRGSVITGRVLDETGEPMPGTTVRVMAYEYAQGNRQLVPAGSAQTDDRGEYRVWGLNPGDYYVSATAQNVSVGGRGGFAPPLAAGGGSPAGGRGGRGAGGTPTADDSGQIGYAPTYFPDVASVTDARPVTAGLGAEVADVNFNLLLVRTSLVAGHVTNPDGTPTTSGNVTLTPESQSQAGRGGPFGGNYGSRTQGDGRFSIANVPPGRYTLRARGENAKIPEYAAEPLVVTGGDTTDMVVVLAPAGTIVGTITLQATQSATVPDVSQFRITAPAEDFSGIGPNGNARVAKDGTFTLDGIAAGTHLIRAQAPRGWMLKSVLVSGREVIDTPFELRSGQNLADVNVIFSDKLSEIDGTVTDDQGTPLTDYTVLAFPDDSSLWRPQARQIMTARPDQNGKFQIRGLPPGQYFLATIDPAQQGEWFEPAFLNEQRAGAVRVGVSEGDMKTQDFKVSVK